MNANIRKNILSGIGALIVTGALASTPALARGGHGGGGFGDLLSNIGDFASNFSDSGSGGSKYSNTPTYSYNKPCHNENRPLYDDNDKVVAHQVVMVCPAK